MSDLTPRQQRFVDEYRLSLNATQAAIKAGYSAKTAKAQGSRLLTNVAIQKNLVEHRKKTSARYEISLERLLKETASIAFSDIGDYLDWKDGTVTLRKESAKNGRARRAIASIKEAMHEEGGADVQVKLHDKMRAIEFLGKYLGVFDSKASMLDINPAAAVTTQIKFEIIGCDGMALDAIAEQANRFMDPKK